MAEDAKQRFFTAKSIGFGLLGIFLIAGLAGYHDFQISFWPPMVGTHLPIGAYFFITLVALGWNLLAGRFFKRLVLTPRELMVVLAMTFMACYPPTSGVFRFFNRLLVLPWFYLASGAKTDWEQFGVLNYLSPALFPEPTPVMKDGILQLDETVYRGFYAGLAQGNRNLGLLELPLAAWIRPMLYWGPLFFLVSLCVMAMSLIVHRQWAHHEQLSYPLAQVATSFIQRKEGRGIPDLFRNPLFWWGFVPLFTLYAIDYLHQWFPHDVPGMAQMLPNLKSWATDIQTRIPILKNAPGSSYLGWQKVYFAVVGLAYFVSSEISLTMGLSTILLSLLGVWFFVTTGTPLAEQDISYGYAGAYIGYALILLYTGHSYYGPLLRRALRRVAADEPDAPAVMAARLLLLAFIGTVALLAAMGMDWLVALFFTFAVLLLFLVFTRVICETGIPFLQPGWLPATLLLSLAGPSAIGPGPMVYTLYVGSVLCQDPKECLMPYVSTTLKMADDMKAPLRRIFALLVGAVAIALVVGFLAASWNFYNFGAMKIDSWAFKSVPTIHFDSAARELSLMTETGVLETSRQAAGLAKLRLLAPNTDALGYLAAGAIAVVLFSMLRFRFARFPLHPVLFLVGGTYPASLCWSSFLIGWGIKTLVVRFGGGKVYQNLKPVFVGIIAAELIIAGISIFVEMFYFAITGDVPPVKFEILPG